MMINPFQIELRKKAQEKQRRTKLEQEEKLRK